MATRPNVDRRPSWRNIGLSFGVALAAAAALVAFGLAVRARNDAPRVIPNPVVRLAGIPQTGTVLGSAKAKVTLIEYADQQCPACRAFTVSIFPTVVRQYVRPGKVKMEYRGFPFIGDDSLKGLRFLLAAGRQNHLWDLEEALYRHQGRENGGWITDDLVRELAGKIRGLNVARLVRDANSDAIDRQAAQAEPAAMAAGIPGTPTFFVRVEDAKPYAVHPSSVSQFQDTLDDALAS